MNFLKRLFQKKEEKITLSINDLSPWLVKNIKFSLDKEINEFIQEKQNLKQAIKDLETKEIKEPNKKLETAVKTNKRLYITSLQNLESKLNPPEELNYSTLKKYIEEFNEKLKNFNKKTIKNYHIIKTLIGKELERIIETIRAIDNVVKRIGNKIEKENLKAIEDINNKLKEINDLVISNKEKNARLRDFERENEMLLKKEKELVEKIESLKISKEYKDYSELKERKIKLLQEKYDLNSKFLSLFTPLEHSLKKLLKDKEQGFLKEPEIFLLNNKEQFKLILKQLNQNTESSELGIKNPQKVQIQVNSLLGFIEKFIENTERFEKELIILENKIENNPFEKELNDLIKSLRSNEKELSEIERLLQESKEKDINGHIESIKKDLKKLGFEVNVAVD